MNIHNVTHTVDMTKQTHTYIHIIAVTFVCLCLTARLNGSIPLHRKDISQKRQKIGIAHVLGLNFGLELGLGIGLGLLSLSMLLSF